MAKDLTYLGVDIGASGIKVVEVANDAGRARLLTYGATEYSGKEPPRGDIFQNAELTGRELAELCKKAGVKSKNAIAGLPVSSVFSTIFSFLDATNKDLEAQIKAKLKNLAPIAEDDMAVDWKKLGVPDKDKLVKISVTAASKKQINGYVQIFKAAGLALSSLETEAFAMIRSLLGKDSALSVIIDIGGQKTNILVVKNGTALISRTVKAGGADITKILSERLKIGIYEAEEVKKNFNNGEFAAIFKEVLAPVINEIKYCENLYSEQYNEGKIEKLVLTGGAAGGKGTVEFMSSETGLRVFIGDPWARMIYPEELRPDLDAIGSRFGVAAGLAMREFM